MNQRLVRYHRDDLDAFVGAAAVGKPRPFAYIQQGRRRAVSIRAAGVDLLCRVTQYEDRVKRGVFARPSPSRRSVDEKKVGVAAFGPRVQPATDQL